MNCQAVLCELLDCSLLIVRQFFVNCSAVLCELSGSSV